MNLLTEKLDKISNKKIKVGVYRTLTSFVIMFVVAIIIVFSVIGAYPFYSNTIPPTQWLSITNTTKIIINICLLILISFLSFLGIIETFRILNQNQFQGIRNHKFFLFGLVHYAIGFIPSIFILHSISAGAITDQKTFFIKIFLIFIFMGLIYFSVIFLYLKKINYTPVRNERVIFLILQMVAYFFWNAIFYISVINGWVSVFILLVIASANDTFAYIFGTLFGKRKIFVRISPNKTLAGFVWGTSLSVVLSVGILVLIAWQARTIDLSYQVLNGFWFTMNFTDNNLFNKTGWWWLFTIIVFVLLSLIGTFGDLFYSKMKRLLNIKDFSRLLPGHGGLFDRLDSVSFIYVFFLIINLVDNMIFVN
ncbi:CDP-diglyceride synthetase [Mycoplasmoides fastidiosum]|uniref:Phosphatidate cytidylyltransferase n=1 Tax=Mycoplasmoides fastidiosum TaxID=92758 RepID=A0ABU0LZR5_9BACT|nr:phosphatidate cytidylyltransferase [Mycoplasmoides fastidiosum]MDQ0514196.1 CDP-diglyceride synthetase [Mycoplasmoides fastidiosum]UUD37394.1 phosphatidate cytidylyltransferase [Mycoplasmoides fastidiosum]